MSNAINKPSPKWFRLTKKIWSTTENTVIAILLLMGYANESFAMLIFKIASSYLKDILDAALVSESEDYAGKEVIAAGQEVMFSTNPGDDKPRPPRP